MRIPFVLMSLSKNAPAGWWLVFNRTDTMTRQAVLAHFGKDRTLAYEAALDARPERSLLINIAGGYCQLTPNMVIHERSDRSLTSTRDRIAFPVVAEPAPVRRDSSKVECRREWFTNENPKPSDSTGEMGQ
jgi:hypothetical protein